MYNIYPGAHNLMPIFDWQVELGLEQTDALPTDSFLVSYFHDVATFLQVWMGPAWD